ncbi:MAG: lipid-A-disaccharide synthase [Myxococcota bacterium]
MTAVLMAVGDASGDKYAADFVRELRKLDGDLEFRGLGGVELENAGMELVVDQRNLAVGGVVELIPHVDRIVSSWRKMVSELRSRTPDLLVLVDSSGFNLPYARRAQRARIPILYYISPQVWAWRRGRVRKLASRVDRMAVIFPFEPAVYEGSGLAAEFVGHPLVDRLEESTRDLDRDEIRRSLGIGAADRVVALLPGSRKTELRHCLGVHLDTAKVLHACDPRIRFLLPVAPSIDRDDVMARIRDRNLPGLLRLDLTDGRSPEAVIASDVIVAKPGTATIEAVLLGRPLVIAARGNPISAALLRRLLKVDFLGMPNLISGQQIVPEFLQNKADPQEIAMAVLGRLDGPVRERQLAQLAEVRSRLGKGGAARRVAAIAQEMLVAGAGA